MKTFSRRDALKQLGAVSAGAAIAPRLLFQTGGITIDGRPVEVTVFSMNATTLRLIVTPLVDGNATLVPDDGVLDAAQFAKMPRPFRGPGMPAVESGDLVVRFSPNPPVFTVFAKGTLLQTITLSPDAPTARFTLPKGPLLGLGEGGPQFDRKGSTDRMRSGQGGYNLRTHGGRVPIQWMVGTDGWGMYIHQPLGTFDFTGAEGVFTHTGGAVPLDIFIVASSDPTVLMREYARITGLAEMPPLWSFGYLQSHRTLGGPEEILNVAKTFREKKLPCDALIYLGTDFTPSGWNTHNGEYAWNPKNFPDPKKALAELHALNYKVVLHTVIEGQRFLGKVSDPCTAPDVPPGRMPPVPPDRAPAPENRWPPERIASCYWPSHKPLFDLGIDGFWPDQGDGYDAASRLARIRMYYEGSQQWRPNQRVFALHRNGYAGMQRYAAFLWSGDVFTTWETLKTHVPVAVNTGLSGIPFWGTDIGGFVPTAEYTGELHVRWFQFGAFNTLFRAHGRNWHLRLPWGWNLGTLPLSEINRATAGAADPDPSELNNAQVEPICRKYLELRYRLMPYLYSAVRECCQTGMPVLRALWLHYPDDPAAVGRGDQYLWGRDMLVAPVVEKGATSRKLYLPRGAWYDFWTNTRVDGGREIDRAVDLETTPLYVRAGAIVPMGPVREYTEQPVAGPLTLTVYPGADGSFTVYDDDGRTFDYRKGAWMGIVAQWRDKERQLTLSLAPGSRMLAPNRRPIEVRVAGTTTVEQLVFEGKPVFVKWT